MSPCLVMPKRIAWQVSTSSPSNRDCFNSREHELDLRRRGVESCTQVRDSTNDYMDRAPRRQPCSPGSLPVAGPFAEPLAKSLPTAGAVSVFCGQVKSEFLKANDW